MDIINHGIDDTFSIDGKWWLPSTPGKKFNGTLTYNPEEGIILNLHGCFDDSPDPFKQSGFFNPTIVNGLSIRGDSFTVLHCHEIRSNRNATHGISKSSYSVEYLLNGLCVSAVSDISITKVCFSLDLLEEWIGTPGFEVEYLRSEVGIDGLRAFCQPTTYFHKQIDSINCGLKITDDFRIDSDVSDLRELVVIRNARIEVTLPSNETLEPALKLIFSLRDLFSLFSGYAMDFKSVLLELGSRKGGTVWASLFFRQKGVHKGRMIRGNEFPFRLADFTVGELQSAFENWFKKAADLQTVFNLNFGIDRFTETNFNIKFLTLMQALETFHRTVHGGYFLDPVEYRDRIVPHMKNSIPTGIEPDHRQSLESRLTFGNEYSLRKRLKQLFGELSCDCQSLVTSEPSTFVNRIIATRNYLTHYSDSVGQDVLDGVDVVNAFIKLRLLLHILILKEIGIEDERINQAFAERSQSVQGYFSEVQYSSTDAHESE